MRSLSVFGSVPAKLTVLRTLPMAMKSKSTVAVSVAPGPLVNVGVLAETRGLTLSSKPATRSSFPRAFTATVNATKRRWYISRHHETKMEMLVLLDSQQGQILKDLLKILVQLNKLMLV